MSIHDCFELDETVALVLEYAEGGSVADRLDQAGPYAWRNAVGIMGEVLRGLAALHAAGIIHRDVKPDNILLSKDDNGRLVPKLTDLGIAHNQDGTRLTRDGSRLGTPEYMAPRDRQAQQVLRKRHLCLRRDAEMLSGVVPFAVRTMRFRKATSSWRQTSASCQQTRRSG